MRWDLEPAHSSASVDFSLRGPRALTQPGFSPLDQGTEGNPTGLTLADQGHKEKGDAPWPWAEGPLTARKVT